MPTKPKIDIEGRIWFFGAVALDIEEIETIARYKPSFEDYTTLVTLKSGAKFSVEHKAASFDKLLETWKNYYNKEG